MPLFYYVSKTSSGKSIKEVEEASSREDLIRRLKERKLFIISVRQLEDRHDLTAKNRLLGNRRKHRGVKLLDLAFFARNLSTTLSAGVPLLKSLEIMSSQTESSKMGEIILNIIRDIKRGFSLSESIAKYGNIFSSLWTGIVEVGETSGNLPFVLERLADYLELRLDFERKVKSALIYPTILIIVACIAVMVFFKIIMPRFTSIFKEFNVTLPVATRILFNISSFVDKNFIWIVLFFGVIGGVLWLSRRHPAAKKIYDKVVLKMPVVSQTVLLNYLERFSSTMYILLESGVPIVHTLEVTSRSIGNTYLEKEIMRLQENVKKGRSLSSELEKVPMFPSLVTEITHIGEEAGNLPEMFKKISVHYQKDMTTRMERMLALFEPLIIVFMGLIIGSIVIALFLPLFKMSTMGGTKMGMLFLLMR